MKIHHYPQLVRNFRVSKSQITSRMDELVSEGLVDRVHDENDRRIIRNINK